MNHRGSKARRAARNLLIASVSALSIAGTAAAQTASHNFDIPAQDAVTALQSFAKQSGKQILFPYDAARGRRTPAVHGVLSDGQALSLLAGSAGLEVASDDGSVITLRPRSVRPQTGGETTAAEPPSQVEELVVTANRRAQRLVDVPMSVTALTGQDIERQGIENVLDLSRATPGLTVVDDGPGQTRIFIRGIANGNSSTSLVGVYLDEAPVTGSSLGQMDLRLNDLERVEVLRGPQGTLYGQGSAGGTIRYITHAPDLQQMSAQLEAQAYATDKGAGSAEVTGVLNLPVVKDVFGLRVTGDFADIGGWVDQPAAGRKDINNQNLRDVRVKARFAPNDRFKIDASALIHRNDGDGLVAGVDADGNVSFPYADPRAREHLVDNFDVYNATASYDLGGVTLLSSTSYVKSHKDVLGIQVQLPPYQSINHDIQNNRVFTQEVRLSSSAHGRFNWVAGVFYDDETLDRLLTLDQYTSGVFLGQLPLPTLDGTKSWSVFGDASYEVTPRLELGAGVRYFRDNRTETSGGLDLEDTFTSVDPRFYATYALAPGVKVYANIAKGFRSGGFAGDTTMRSFGPENIWSYEAGVKGARGPFRFELDGFYGVYKDIQTFALTGLVTGGLVNSGTAHIYGAEGLVALDVTPQLTLQASGAATHARLVSVLPTSLSNQVGDRVDFVPDYNFQLSAEYRFEWAIDVPGYIRADYDQIGPATFTDHSAGLPSWVGARSDTIGLLNARLGVGHDRWTAELFGENLLNENGVQDPLAIAGFGARPRPRVIGVKLGAAF